MKYYVRATSIVLLAGIVLIWALYMAVWHAPELPRGKTPGKLTTKQEEQIRAYLRGMEDGIADETEKEAAGR